MTGLSEAEYRAIATAVHDECGDCPSGAAGMAQWLGVPYHRRPGAEHEYTSDVFDQPERIPTASLVLAATYRSGSTALAEDLISAGGYGWPLEYFQAGARDRRFARFAGPEYAAAVMRHRTDPGGVFGVKLFPADLRDDPELWLQLPRPTVVRVRRRDRVGQAVSAWRALNGGAWRAAAGGPTAPPPEYDYDCLRRLVGLFAGEDQWWNGHLPDSTLTVWFEDLVTDREEVLDQLFTGLQTRGLPPRQAVGEPRLTRQADADSQALADRFVADHRTRVAG